jgi:hypothetical protein
MEALIAAMTEDHTHVLQLFAAVRDLGIGSPASNLMLQKACSALIASFNREERELFPSLEKAGVPDNLRSRVRHSRDGLAELRAQANTFFARWGQGGDGLDFARDFGRLVGAVQFRVRMDETYLYSHLGGGVRQQQVAHQRSA